MSRKGKYGRWKKPLKKEKKIPIEDTVLETLPSKTGSKADGAASETPKTFTRLIKEVAAIKKHLETHSYTRDSKVLSNSVEKVLEIVDRYRCETKNGMPPFDWERKEFLWNNRRSEISLQDARDNVCKSAKKGLTDSPRNSVTGSNTIKGHSLHFHNKEYQGVCSALDVGMEEPMNESSYPTLRRLKRSVARATPSPWVDQPPLIVLRFIPQLLDPNMNDLPLNVKEKKIWLEFKEFDKGTPEAEVINLDNLDHPVVGVIGDFAVAVFNRACEMHVKKGEHNNLHDLEFMECKYMKVTNGYYFYMTIEAIEEGHLGVYETEVVCSSDDGRRILSEFVLTNRTPVGTKAMAIFHFSCVRSICKSLDGVTYLKLKKPDKILNVTKGMERNTALCEKSRILNHHQETIQGLQQVLYLDPPLLFPPDCNRMTNQDVWSHPDDCYYSQMVRRTKGTPCTGYDYINRKGIDSVWRCGFYLKENMMI